MSGRHVCMGYLNMEDKTSETIDEMGRLHSGDVGKKDKDGYLFITGRIKGRIFALSDQGRNIWIGKNLGNEWTLTCYLWPQLPNMNMILHY
jgi:long-subunit acyl-CoA synthetase (AMP-forming)